jgi:hypothetical protein
MWHHPATVKARVRRWSGLAFRPVAVAFDPRLEGLEHRVVERLERRLAEVETRVAADAEVMAEMTITQSRLLARLESRLAALEGGAGDDGPGFPGWAPIVSGWVLGTLAALRAPARIGLMAVGEPGMALALVGLGHEVVLLEEGTPAPVHPRVRRLEVMSRDVGSLDAAVLLGAGAGGVVAVDAARSAAIAALLSEGGVLLATAPLAEAAVLEALVDTQRSGLHPAERLVAAPGSAGVWEVMREGAPAGGEGVVLLRAIASR